jgi:hypothetical protein
MEKTSVSTGRGGVSSYCESPNRNLLLLCFSTMVLFQDVCGPLEHSGSWQWRIHRVHGSVSTKRSARRMGICSRPEDYDIRHEQQLHQSRDIWPVL